VTSRLHSWPANFATPYLGRKPKVRVVTFKIGEGINHEFHVKELVPILLF